MMNDRIMDRAKTCSTSDLRQDFKELAAVADTLSRLSQDEKFVLIRMITGDHRTCQQLVMGFCLDLIYAMADNGFDTRNEASVKAAQVIRKALGEYGNRLPYV